MTVVDDHLKWAPVWSNVFYFIYGIVSIAFLFVFRNRQIYFRPVVWLLFITMFLESIISTIHHVYTSQFNHSYDDTKEELVGVIVDEIFAFTTGFMCIFIIACKVPKTLTNILSIVTIALFLIISFVFYGLDILYGSNDDVYDFYHTLWHMCTFIVFMITTMYIFYNKQSFGYDTTPYKIEKWIYPILICVLTGISVAINLLCEKCR